MAILFRQPNYFTQIIQDIQRISDLFDAAEDAPMENSKEDNGMTLDVSEFKPEELKMSLDGRILTVEGCQEQQEEGSYFKRSFVRKWRLSKNADLSAIRSQLSDDGKLAIEVPKKTIETGIQIPIERNN